MDQQQLSRAAGEYQAKGYALLENFLSPEEVGQMNAEINRLIRDESAKEEHAREAKKNHFYVNSAYHAGSIDKVRFFHELTSLKPDAESGEPEFCVPWEQSMAYLGFGLHFANSLFNKISTSEKIKQVFRAINYRAPTIVESVVILKNKQIGGPVPAHQDASSLLAEPETVVGFWMALDDATSENGCMQFIPGSHKSQPVGAKLMRTLDANGHCQIKCVGEPTKWDQHESEFVDVAVKAGTLVVFAGPMVHRSKPNVSDKPRRAYSLHAYDKKTSKWSEANQWQPAEENPGCFITLYGDGA